MSPDDYAPPPRNYYPSQLGDASSYKYRLEGRDIIKEIVDTLKGGVKDRRTRPITYFIEQRIMNDLGVERVKLIVQSGVNKVAHLTKYSSEDRILKQMQSIMRAFIYEIVLNAKRWAPDGHRKVRNMRLVIQMVENAIYQSLLRGTDGFEASLTAKSHTVSELVDNRNQGGGGRTGFIGRLFGRNNPPPDYGGGY